MHRASLALFLCWTTATTAVAQDRGAAALQKLVSGLTVTSRVLVVGVHPDDAGSPLAAALGRGHGVQVAYLSLTRGEGAPNYLGAGGGSALGVIRTLESLDARRVDGAEQYFGRSYDFGYERDTTGVFKRWARDSVVGDVVTVIRSFRPHVIVTPFDQADLIRSAGDAQHIALLPVVRDAFAAAGDTARFSARQFGYPWMPSKLYHTGLGVAIDAGALDPVLGATYANVAQEANAKHRSQGLLEMDRSTARVHLLRVIPEMPPEAQPEPSVFESLDTTFARHWSAAPDSVAAWLRLLVAHADSANAVLDVARPDSAVRHLARVVSLSGFVRSEAAWCRHPTAVVNMPTAPPDHCTQAQLDLDGSIDRVRRRASDALIAAAGVEIEATGTRRERLAESDTGTLGVRVRNHGRFDVHLEHLFHAQAIDTALSSTAVPPGKMADAWRRVAGLPDGHPWWLRNLKDNRFPETPTLLDGSLRSPHPRLHPLSAPSVAVPEQLRHTSGLILTMTIAGATVSTRIGPEVVLYSDHIVGVQRRPMHGAPDVTIKLGRALEWIPTRRSVRHPLRVAVENVSTKRQTVRLGFVTPPGVRVDSAPTTLVLEPHEQRELFLQLRARIDSAKDKQIFGIVGRRPGYEPLITGYQLIQYPHLPPIRIARQSGLWLQPVDIVVPRNLAAVYIPGVSDDVHLALRDIGMNIAVVNAEDFHQVNLGSITTVVLGPRALESRRELLPQMARLIDWVRTGGTLVIQRGGAATVHSRALPFPAAVSGRHVERVVSATGPVTVLYPNARLLKWPNVIRDADWAGWVSGRTGPLPTGADDQYARFIAVHDEGQPANNNAILLGQVGKGAVVYTALTLDEQISGGVPGALRLLVNLMSAALPAVTAPTGR